MAEVVEKTRPDASVSLGGRLLKGGAWVLAGRIVAAVAGFLVSMLLARLLSPGELGAYFIVVSITVTGAILAQFGTHQSVVRLIAAGLARSQSKEVRLGLRAVLLIAMLGVVIVGGGYSQVFGEWISRNIFHSEAVATVAGLTTVWLALRVGQTLLSQTFRGFHDLRLAAIFNGASTQLMLLFLLLLFWLSIEKLSLTQAVQATVVAFAVTVMFGVYLLRRRLVRLPQCDGIAFGETLRISAPLFVSSTSFIVLGEMHLWILGAVDESNQVAVYGAAYRLMQLVVIPLSLINNIIPPMIAELYSQGKLSKVERVLRSTAVLAAFPALTVLAMLVLYADQLLEFSYGEYYAKGGAILVIMAIGQAINVLTGSPGVLLAMSDSQQILMKISVSGGLIGIVISAALVWQLGSIGIAIGYAAGLALQNVAMSHFCWRRLGIKTFAGRVALSESLSRLRDEVVRFAHRLRTIDENNQP